VTQPEANPAIAVLPEAVAAYKRTRLFTPETLPQALQQNHSTKEGVWGLIVIESGAVRYTREGHPATVLRVGDRGVILPTEPHAVAFTEDGAFYVEFYRATLG
jgi:tellurite resistance-related uncharacterized protein